MKAITSSSGVISSAIRTICAIVLSVVLIGSAAYPQASTVSPKAAKDKSQERANTGKKWTPKPAAATLQAATWELDDMAPVLAQSAMTLSNLDFELGDIPSAMGLDIPPQFNLGEIPVAPVAPAQASAALAIQSAALAQFPHSFSDGESYGQDAATAAPQESGAAAKAYQKAYGLVLDKKWTEAQKELDTFVGKYRNSSYTDAARYWKCYTKEKLGDSYEQVFKSYQEFVKSYPHSRWADDARTNMVRIGSELAKQGKSEYSTIVRSMQEGDDEDVKLTALYALAGNADEKSLPIIIGLYDQSKSEKLRQKIVYVLGNFDSPQVVPKLADIAMKDPSIGVRKNAVYALGNTKKSEAAASLKQIVKSQTDLEVRTTALYSLANIGDEKLVPFLAEVAKSDPDDKMARTAAYSIANVNTDESSKALRMLLKESSSKEVRKAALHSIANRGDASAVSTLKEIVANEADLDMRRTAVYALGNVHSSESFEALKSVALSSGDTKVKEAAVQAIGNNGGSEAREFLKKLALSDQDDNVARMAVYSVGNSHEGADDADANFYMEVLKKAKSVEVRKAALYQFANVNKSSSVKTLGQFVKDEKDSDLRIAALYVLGNTKSDDAVDILLGVARTDATKKARTAAVSALSNIGTKKAQDALLQILEGKTKE